MDNKLECTYPSGNKYEIKQGNKYDNRLMIKKNNDIVAIIDFHELIEYVNK